MAQTYQDAYNSLGNIYDPQTSLVNTQIAALPGEYAPQYSALDQAKVNAFRSIDESANAKGMLFSGFSPDQQAQYIGTKYLPARAALATQQQQRTFSLKDKLNQINASRSSQAQNSVAEQQKAELEAQKYAQDQAYKQAQLSLGYARLGASQRNAAADGVKGYKANTLKSGNYDFRGPNNAPISAYEFAQATGASLLDLLKNSGSKYDKRAYQDATYWLSKGGESLALSNLQKKYSKLF